MKRLVLLLVLLGCSGPTEPESVTYSYRVVLDFEPVWLSIANDYRGTLTLGEEVEWDVQGEKVGGGMNTYSTYGSRFGDVLVGQIVGNGIVRHWLTGVRCDSARYYAPNGPTIPARSCEIG